MIKNFKCPTSCTERKFCVSENFVTEESKKKHKDMSKTKCLLS